ncbi:MAG: GNAT family N-acetyltransferase [Cyanobacteria bacterium P01_G01_bin.38]
MGEQTSMLVIARFKMPPSTMTAIFKLRESHLTACSQLSVSVFNSEPWCENWTLETAQARLLHLFQSPGFVGFGTGTPAVIGLVLGNWEPWEDHKLFYLREICIHPAHQRQGLGSQLIKFLLTHLSQIQVRHVYLVTQKGILAERFYLKHGFAPSERILMPQSPEGKGLDG